VAGAAAADMAGAVVADAAVVVAGEGVVDTAAVVVADAVETEAEIVAAAIVVIAAIAGNLFANCFMDRYLARSAF